MKVNHIYQGDSLKLLKELPDQSVNCCITSPPYWGLRNYGVKGQLGLENTPEEYLSNMVDLFTQVKRVLKNDGILWLNLGDTYANSSSPGKGSPVKRHSRKEGQQRKIGVPAGFKSKDLIGIPWMVAFALRADGWYLRQDIIWHKPNPMPESVTDRCTKSHEYMFLLSKSKNYYFNNKAIQELANYDGRNTTTFNGSSKYATPSGWDTSEGSHDKKIGNYSNRNPQTLHQKGQAHERWIANENDEYIRNKRSVWTVASKPFSGAHFATFPEELILPCVLSGCPEGGIILDPFMGAGTTALVAKKNGCNYVGIELNQDYIDLSEKRLSQEYLFK